MLNRSASLAMSTSVLKTLPGKLDIKRHSPSILYLAWSLFEYSQIIRLFSVLFLLAEEGFYPCLKIGNFLSNGIHRNMEPGWMKKMHTR